jgi:hypothetical protein
MYFKIKEVYILLFISAITLIIILAYPLYLRLFYKRHLSKIVDENCKNAIGKTNSLEIVDGFIVLKEDGSESELKLAIEEIKEIIEIQNNYFAVVDDVSSIIMPKNNEAHEFVNVLVNNYNIKLKRELNWKWK